MVWVAWVSCGAGCSLLFDPSGVVPGAPRDAASPPDLHAIAVEDLSVPDDLAVAVPDLAPASDLETEDLQKPRDLLTPDLRPCVPPQFVGFWDGGAKDPFDCNVCGCVIDNLDNAASLALKLNHGAIATFTETVTDGGLTFVGTAADVRGNPPNPSGGDYDEFNSSGKFYVDGDFDMELDYQAQTWPSDSHLQLYALGPRTDGGFSQYAPEGIVQTYNSGGLTQFWFYTDDRVMVIDTTLLSGTMRIRRISGKLCASVTGQTELCHSGTSQAPAYVQLEAVVSDPSCVGLGCTVNYKVRVSKLRLLHGSLVAKP